MLNLRRALQASVFVLIFSFFPLALGLDQESSDYSQSRVNRYRRIAEVVSRIEDSFYKKIEEEKLLEDAIKGMLTGLGDPYSFYQSPDAQKREQEDIFHAKFGGLGILIVLDSHGFVTVSRPLEGSPAMKAGIQPGDKIIKVNGELVKVGQETLLSFDDVIGKLRGEVGSKVTLNIVRRGREEQPFDITLTRDVIKRDSVEYTMLENNIGYVMITNFTGRTDDEFKDAISAILKLGIKSMILDLRYNSGGLLSSAVNISDAFLSDGVIVSTRGRKEEFNREYPAKPPTMVSSSIPLIVLVNESSASGSEIVAGAIKDSKRGVLVGAKTFGKGVVQERFPLKNGGAVSITISTYYTPNGTSIDGEGITPNVVIEDLKLTDEEVHMRSLVRQKDLIENFVVDYLKKLEAQNGGKVSQDFKPLEAKLPDVTQILEKNQIKLPERLVKSEMRRSFNNNTGAKQIVYLDEDPQLVKAMEIIKNGEVAKILTSSK